MGRTPCCEKMGLKKGPWTPEEDQKLLAFIQQNGHGSWRALPPKAGLQRCGKSCRLRWTNYLRPDIKRGDFTLHEEQTIIQLHALLGNRWSAIATHLPKRTDNEIKNYWNTHLKKKLTKMGIDPATHKPINNEQSSVTGAADHPIATTLSHRAQWETARLEAEARLARQSKLQSHSPSTQQLLNSEADDEIRVWSDQWPSKSTEQTTDKIFPADLESPTTSSVTLFVTPPSKLPEYTERAGNSLSFAGDDFSDVLLKNSDNPTENLASNGSGSDHDNKDYWDSILGEFLPF